MNLLEQTKKNEMLQKYHNEKSDIILQAESFEIKTAEDIKPAAAFVLDQKFKIKFIKSKLDPLVNAAYQSHKTAKSFYNEAVIDYETAWKKVATVINEYKTEQARILREQEEKLQRDAERREAKRKAVLRERAERQAEKGNTGKAEELKQEADSYFEPRVTLAGPEKTTRTGSGSVTATPDIEIDYNIDDVMRAVIKCDLPVECVSVNESVLKKHCITAELKSNQIPGIFIKHTTKTSYRG